MLDMTKVYSLILTWMAMMLTQVHRVTGKLELVPSKVAWSNSDVHGGWFCKGDDREKEAYGKYGSFEHLSFLLFIFSHQDWSFAHSIQVSFLFNFAFKELNMEWFAGSLNGATCSCIYFVVEHCYTFFKKSFLLKLCTSGRVLTNFALCVCLHNCFIFYQSVGRLRSGLFVDSLFTSGNQVCSSTGRIFCDVSLYVSSA